MKIQPVNKCNSDLNFGMVRDLYRFIKLAFTPAPLISDTFKGNTTRTVIASKDGIPTRIRIINSRELRKYVKKVFSGLVA